MRHGRKDTRTYSVQSKTGHSRGTRKRLTVGNTRLVLTDENEHRLGQAAGGSTEKGR